MDVTIQELDNTGQIKLMKLVGEMDALLAASIDKEIEKLISHGCRGLSLDMSGVAYIDSSGIRVLLSTYKKLAKLGGKMNLLSPSERVVSILELADLMDVLKTVNSVDEAAADLSGAP
jgi:anti-sigma B factor antagonist